MIERSISIEGSHTSVLCMDDNTQPAIEIRSNDVLLGGFSFVGCNLNSTSGLIQVKGAENVTLRDLVFENNANTNGPSCVSAIHSTIWMKNITAKNNTGVNGGAMFFAEGSEVVVVDSFFESNHATQQGGAIYMNNSNLDLSNSRFTENLAFDDGGAIFAVGEKKGSEVNMRDVEYFGNRVYGEYKNDLNWRVGGGIALLGPKLNAEIWGVTFVNNSAVNLGGSINAFNGTKVSVHESTFVENHSFQGGAIFMMSSLPNVTTLDLNRCNFTRNHGKGSVEGFSPLGGAVAIANNGTEAMLKECTFIENKVGAFGGAVYASGSKSMNILRSDFLGNQVGHIGVPMTSKVASVEVENESRLSFGGAVYLSGVSEISVLESSFTQNQAKIGGALSLQTYAPATTNLEVRGTTFESNSAVGDSVDDYFYGGAMRFYGNGSSITLENVLFSDNTAQAIGGTVGGGAVCGSDIKSIKIFGSIFNRNKAVERQDSGEQEGVFVGGALLLLDVPEILIEKSTFSANQAASSAGAIFILAVKGHGSDANISGCTFAGNSALGVSTATYGGGLDITGDGVRALIMGSNFTQNKATGLGGALYSRAITSLEISHSFFVENKAAKSFGDSVKGTGNLDDAPGASTLGGAIHLENVSETAIVNSIFSHNEAAYGGGISGRECMFLIEGSSFQDNVALNNGGAIEVTSTNATIVKTKFTSNIANVMGGAILSGHISSVAEAKPYLKTKEVVLKGNHARQSGGGLYLVGVDLEMEDSLCRNNSAEEFGGAFSLIQLQVRVFVTVFEADGL
ncbi:hypothetical protein BSKO_06854 [Bryopsis sp. KO-2023]|nr:hypothetical protein BSKO_06854 [Bryopsis sp. KO-2023]